MAEMSDRLKQIIAYKQDEVVALKKQRTFASLEAEARAQAPPRDLAKALLDIAAADGNALICEMKRRSPSAGAINESRDPLDAARAYEVGGAACISVLTDGPSFGGELADMTSVRANVSIPVLRKDFMVDPIQVAEARAAGADAILIIMAALDDAQAANLHATADSLGLSVLLEVHDEAELQRALRLPSPLIGVNNRDLRHFSTDLATTERLAPLVPAGRLLISESGMKTPADVSRLRPSGARGFLIGEALMRAENPAESVRSFVVAR